MTMHIRDNVSKLMNSTTKLIKSKVKEYPDGTCKITVYADSIIVHEGGSSNFGTAVLNDAESKTEEEIAKEREEARLRKFWQVKTKIKDYVLCNEFTHFWTLTQDEKIVGDRHDDQIALDNLSRFLSSARKQARRKGLDFYYIFVPERHKSGALHFHGFTVNFPSLLIDSGHKWKGKPIYNCKQWKYGFSDVTELADRKKAANYCTKYITKELSDQGLGKNKKKYWSSRGLREPVVRYSDEDLGKDLTPSWVSPDNRVTIYTKLL